MAAEDFFVALAPVEDLRGGGSRTRHIILKRRSASFSQSVYSCPVFEKFAPNRDYPYEGLCCLAGGENWKFIDTIATGIKISGKYVEMIPSGVRASPWDCEYTYKARDLEAFVHYYLYETGRGGMGQVTVRVKGNAAKNSSIVFEPFFDIRFMYAESTPQLPDVRHEDGRLTVSSGEKTALLVADDAKWTGKGRMTEWQYKLGSGYRRRQGEDIRFVAESRPIRSFSEIEVPADHAKLQFACDTDIKAAGSLIDSKPVSDDTQRALQIKEALFPDYRPDDRNVLLRAIAMDRFGMDVDHTKFHEAGDFWFRSVWFRDEFEGLINSYHACKKIDGTDNMIQILRKSFDRQDEHGRIPNRLVPGTGGKPDYNSADASLLAFILAGMVVRDTCDERFATESASAFNKFMQGIRKCQTIENGPPRLMPNGLISVPAWHSWTDGMRKIDGRDVPIRADETMERELIAKSSAQELNQQKFFLPEINAQWMKALEAGWLFCRYTRDFSLADRCKIVYNGAKEAFRAVFLNPYTGFINNLVTTDDFALGRRTDATAGSPGIVAAAILGLDVFTLRELQTIAKIARERLLRTKWGLPFGIVVKEGDRNEYLGDPEYHESVVWPRDTPYFLRLLKICGDKTTLECVLKSNIKHQMEEGFVFYNNELFSTDNDLLPVKNPVQWWSQWLDPYIEQRRPFA